MNAGALRELVKTWDLENADDSVEATAYFDDILSRLEWFGSTEWSRYLPAQHPDFSTSYLSRLAGWIGNVTDVTDRKLLLKYAQYIAFFSHADFCALYQTAFSGAIARWIVEQEVLALDDPHFDAKLQEEIHQRTWYCPVTDSMDINEFYHANHLVGVSHRPGFALVKMLDKPDGGETAEHTSRLRRNITKYISDPSERGIAPPLKRLVLLEDFVGSGNQSAGALDWAVRNLTIPILFVPLVLCPLGFRRLAGLEVEHAGRLRICPILHLRERDLLGPGRAGATGIPNADAIEALARATFEKVAGGPHTDELQAPYTAFGFKQTGPSFVSYSNTPNNSLPLIHHRPSASGWRPLFPRSARA